MGKKAKVKNQYVKIGGVYYEPLNSATKATVSRKVYDVLKGMYNHPAVWLQANNVEDVVFMAMAEAAVRAVRAWDNGETSTSEVANILRNNSKISDAVKKVVRVRSGGRCEIALFNCAGYGEDYHHVIHREQGGASSAENLKYTCKPCHLETHGRKFNRNRSHYQMPAPQGDEPKEK